MTTPTSQLTPLPELPPRLSAPVPVRHAGARSTGRWLLPAALAVLAAGVTAAAIAAAPGHPRTTPAPSPSPPTVTATATVTPPQLAPSDPSPPRTPSRPPTPRFTTSPSYANPPPARVTVIPPPATVTRTAAPPPAVTAPSTVSQARPPTAHHAAAVITAASSNGVVSVVVTVSTDARSASVTIHAATPRGPLTATTGGAIDGTGQFSARLATGPGEVSVYAVVTTTSGTVTTSTAALEA